jgi:dimethylhistidine N-methyltransferase
MSSVLESLQEDAKVAETSMRDEVLAGLSQRRKRLPSKFFYDARGSSLFEAICEQPEYYLTRAELEIMRVHGAAIGWAIGERARLVEFGSGSGVKTRMLLHNLKKPVAYVPIEVSEVALAASVSELRASMPGLEILPMAADFTRRLMLPKSTTVPRRTVVYFPGSTLGNFEPVDALALLKGIRLAVGMGGGAVIGIDLRKDEATMTAAYNDHAGVTAEFTLNMLAHLNRAVGTDFDLDAFRHHAVYDAEQGRIETNIVSLADQVVRMGDVSFEFSKGERLLVEYSHKYSLEEFEGIVQQAGMRVTNVWTDEARRFAVVHTVSNLLSRA